MLLAVGDPKQALMQQGVHWGGEALLHGMLFEHDPQGQATMHWLQQAAEVAAAVSPSPLPLEPGGY